MNLLTFEPTEENLAKVATFLLQPLMQHYKGAWRYYNPPIPVFIEENLQALALLLLKEPVLRMHLAWLNMNREGMSPFGHAAVAQVYPEDVLKSAEKSELFRIGFCSTTRLPVVKLCGILNLTRGGGHVSPGWKPGRVLSTRGMDTFDYYSNGVVQYNWNTSPDFIVRPLKTLLEEVAPTWKPEEGVKNASYYQCLPCAALCKIDLPRYQALRSAYLMEPLNA